MSLAEQLKQEAKKLGFELVGVAPAVQAPGWERFQRWLNQGYAGEMEYLHRYANERSTLESILPGCESIVMLAISYHQPGLRLNITPKNHGRVASYAQGYDYHRIIWDKLDKLAAWLTSVQPESKCRGVVDTAPLLERDYARLAGLGWFGKNTMLINKYQGSFFFLSALLTTLPLQADEPHTKVHCGTCTACMDACPTKAFPEPGVLDSSKCISYLTIEKRGHIPLEMRSSVGDWLFGCDVCQDVCPWNRKAPDGREKALMQPAWQLHGQSTMDLLQLLNMEDQEFIQLFRQTALWRAKKQGLL
ncbi:MAG TPA: tRNA epoxyqueuosine(34) reductase QueG, partial [Gemmatales bacterium]|nr:tRNA epoxyqueuosine(34) reductase QueG [Gemmatales bacterium]